MKKIDKFRRVNKVLFRKTLDKKKMTNAELSRRMEKKGFPVHPTTVGHWVRGESIPASPAKMEMVAKILGVQVSRLFPPLKDGEERPTRPSNEKSKPTNGLPLFDEKSVVSIPYRMKRSNAETIQADLQSANETLAAEVYDSAHGVDDNVLLCLKCIQDAKKALAAIPKRQNEEAESK